MVIRRTNVKNLEKNTNHRVQQFFLCWVDEFQVLVSVLALVSEIRKQSEFTKGMFAEVTNRATQGLLTNRFQVIGSNICHQPQTFPSPEVTPVVQIILTS